MTRAIILLVAIAACGGTATKPVANPQPGPGSSTHLEEAPPPAAPRSLTVDQALAKYEAWTDQMCACRAGDFACSKRITDEQIAWGQKIERMSRQVQPILDRYTKCAMNAITPPTPPGTP